MKNCEKIKQFFAPLKKIKKSITPTKKDAEDFRLPYKLLKRFFYTYCAMSAVIILVTLFFGVEAVKDGDFQNWTSFVFELGLGIYVATAIVTYENAQKNKLKKQQKKKREYGLQKMKLLLQLAKEEFQDEDYDNAKETFNEIIVTLNILSEVIEASESQHILELSEIGKLFCKYKGAYAMHYDRTLPFTTSIPATKAALFQKFDDTISIISQEKD